MLFTRGMNALVRLLIALLFAWVLGTVPARAASSAEEVQTAWRLLDYVAVDYPEAVTGGKVTNPAEFSEMTEFSASVSAKISALPVKPAQKALVRDARQLEAAIAAKSSAAEIAKQA